MWVVSIIPDFDVCYTAKTATLDLQVGSVVLYYLMLALIRFWYLESPKWLCGGYLLYMCKMYFILID